MFIEEEDNQHLRGLESRFMTALRLRDKGHLDKAEDELRAILKIEPRLAEPQMELARVLLDTDRLPLAEEHARETLRLLETGGQWTDELSEEVVSGIAHALLAEILRRHADEDDVIFGDPAKFHAIVAESKVHFEKAAELDPSDEYASYHAYFMGVEGAELELGGEKAEEPEVG